MIAQVGKVALEAGKTYEFRCMARQTRIVGGSISIAISDMSTWSNCGLDTQLAVGNTWQSYRRVFRAGKSVSASSRLQIWFTETGTLCLADVSIVPTSPPHVELTDVVPPRGGKNLLPNGRFEVGGATWSTFGAPVGWGGMLAHLCGKVINEGIKDHPQFLRIQVGGQQTPVLGFDYPRSSTLKQTRLLAANRHWIAVEPGKPYTLSCDLRASRPGTTAVLGCAQMDPESGVDGMRQEETAETVGITWASHRITFWPTRRFVFVMVGPESTNNREFSLDVDRVQLEQGREATEYEPYADTAISVEPSAPSGIFQEGQTPSLRIRCARPAGLIKTTRLLLTATDYFGRTTLLPDVDVAEPKTEVLLPKSWRGWYRIMLRTLNSRIAITTPEIRVAIIPHRPAKETVLGLNHAFPDPYLIDLAQLVGISQYRDWSFQWEQIEPKRGEFHWAEADSELGRMLDKGLGVTALLPPFPSAEWSSSAPKSLAAQFDLGDRVRQSWAPTDPSDLARFAGVIASRYKNRIHFWEFLNEPIYTGYSLPGPKYGTNDYVSLLKPVAKAVKSADPTCKIIGGAAAGPGRLTREMFESGLLDSIDVLNLHIYPGLTAPEAFIPQMDSLNAEMGKRGKRKPIWITEFSYYGMDNQPREPFIAEPNNWSENRLLNDEKQCADYTVRFLAIMLSKGVEHVFIHSGTNNAVNLPSSQCCLFEYGGVPRKAAAALAVFCKMVGPHPKPIKSFSSTGCYAFSFINGREKVTIAWGTSSLPAVPLFNFKGKHVFDAMGYPLTGRDLRLSESPIYVIEPLACVTREPSRTLMGR
jgi:hypothetical protein